MFRVTIQTQRGNIFIDQYGIRYNDLSVDRIIPLDPTGLSIYFPPDTYVEIPFIAKVQVFLPEIETERYGNVLVLQGEIFIDVSKIGNSNDVVHIRETRSGLRARLVHNISIRPDLLVIDRNTGGLVRVIPMVEDTTIRLMGGRIIAVQYCGTWIEGKNLDIIPPLYLFDMTDWKWKKIVRLMNDGNHATFLLNDGRKMKLMARIEEVKRKLIKPWPVGEAC